MTASKLNLYFSKSVSTLKLSVLIDNEMVEFKVFMCSPLSTKSIVETGLPRHSSYK